MATNKSHKKNPILKMGQMWNQLSDNTTTDEDETEDDDDLSQDNNETMKLRREDMPLFGICPAWDQFYLVVCEYCKQVIKPQALRQHIELRHTNSRNNHLTNSSTVNNNSLKMKNNTTITSNSTPVTANGSDIRNSNHLINKVINKLNESDFKLSVNSTQTVDNVNNDELIDSNSTKTNSNSLTNILTANKIEPLLPEPTGPGPGFEPTIKLESINLNVAHINSIKVNDCLNNSKETIVCEPTILSKPNAKKKSYKKASTPSTRKLLPCKDREYDPNKHCGVLLPDMERPCTRSLTCKTHSLTLRRGVQGRIKNFDELLSEHREAKEAALRAQGIEVKPTKKAILKQQQQLKNSQLKLEPNSQSKSDNSFQTHTISQMSFFSDSELAVSKTQPIVRTNVKSNTNSLLTFNSSPVSVTESVKTQKSHCFLNQINSHPNGLYMSSHPRPAAVCNYNIRTVGNCSRLLSRNSDLTISALRHTFNSPVLVSKLTNNAKCTTTSNSNVSQVSVKSPLRTTNQTFTPNKKKKRSTTTK